MSKPDVTESPQTPAGVCSTELLGVGIEHQDGSVICAACGYEAEWSECGACGGEGGHDGYEQDPLWYQPGELAPCSQCDGGGGDWYCENKNCQTVHIYKFQKAKPTPNNQGEPQPPTTGVADRKNV